MGRPQMRCNGLGLCERMRVPSPAARTMAYNDITPSYHTPITRISHALNSTSDHSGSGERARTPIRGIKIRRPTIERPRNDRWPCELPTVNKVICNRSNSADFGLAVWIEVPNSLACEVCHWRGPMGSLIKKRRKRMRKKKHKKMLRRTRHQRQRK